MLQRGPLQTSPAYSFGVEDPKVYLEDKDPSWIPGRIWPDIILATDPIPPSKDVAKEKRLKGISARISSDSKKLREELGGKALGHTPALLDEEDLSDEEKQLLASLKRGATTCPECKQVFSQAHHCKLHFHSVHLKGTKHQDARHSCTLCLLTLGTKNALDRHMKRHAAEVRDCSRCRALTLTGWEEISAHAATHLQEPCICRHCLRVLKSPAVCKQHEDSCPFNANKPPVRWHHCSFKCGLGPWMRKKQCTAHERHTCLSRPAQPLKSASKRK